MVAETDGIEGVLLSERHHFTIGIVGKTPLMSRTNVLAVRLSNDGLAHGGRFAMLTLEEKFWIRVDRATTPDGCWLWKSSRYSNGYGRFLVKKGKHVLSHRMAWTITYGPIPFGLFVLHTCDNPLCVRPEHLFLGTQKDNMRDMVSKKRNWQYTRPECRPRGERNGLRLHPERCARGDRNGSRIHPELLHRGEQCANAKLTTAMVLEIRSRYADGKTTMKALGQCFGVSSRTISCIIKRRTWKHV